MSSPQRSRSGVHTGAGGHSWVTGVGAAQDRIRAVAGRTDEVLDRLVHAVSELVDAPATVALLEDGELVRRAATGDGRLPLGVRVETATSVCGEALRTGRPVRVGDADALEPGRPDATCCPPARSLLSVPLAVRDTCVGVVALTADRPDWFDGVDENTVNLVAEVAADVLLAALPERVTPRTAAVRTRPPRPAVVDVAAAEGDLSDRAPDAAAEVADVADAEATLVLAAVRADRADRAPVGSQPATGPLPTPGAAPVPPPAPTPAPTPVPALAEQRLPAAPPPARTLASVTGPSVAGSSVTGPVPATTTTAPPLDRPAAGVPGSRAAYGDSAPTAPAPTAPGVPDGEAPAAGPGDGPRDTVDVSDDERSVGDLTVRRDVVPEQRVPSDGTDDTAEGTTAGSARDAADDGAREGASAAGAPAAALPGLPVLGLWQWDAATGLATLSEPVEELTGMPSGRPRVLGAFRALVHPDDVDRVEEVLREAAARPGGDTSVACTFRLCRRDGSERTVQVWGDLQRNRNGLVGAVGVVADVTALAGRPAAPGPAAPAAPAALADPAAHLRAVRELTGAGVWSWQAGANPHEGRLEWSPEMFRLVGLEPGEISPTLAHWHGFVHDEDVDRARAVDLGALGRATGHGETFRVIGADGAIRHVQAWADGTDGRRDEDTADAPRVVHGAAVDVTRQVRDRLRLERLVATDPVTGLPNRAAFERAVTQMLAEPGVDVALLLLDVDRFKQVNDSLGHDVGDRLLLEVARRLHAVVPEGTTVARMGGDEFVVLPRPGSGMLAVRRLAEAVTDALRMPYVLPDSGELLVCPVSLGITSTSGRAVSPQDLLAEAELALYRAKDSGRDRFVVYDEALRARSQSRMRAERLLRGALEHGRLTLQYQPIVDFANGRVVGAEALVRIRDESGDGLLSPDVFIDVAEDTGLVVDLDRWVIESAIDQVERWANQVPSGQEPPWLSVNVSARSMEHPGAVRGLLDAVRQRRVAASDIKVELTERSFLAALPGGEGALRQLLGSGIPVGIDDFGTGYSALGYLNRFELDFMKIDRSFVQSVGEDARADAVVTAIVDLAHAHGMLVTAEGVETPRQARRLREIGCDLAQGYHFGRPADAARIIAG